jgi:tRNA-2-methylthio-N6-dimethylallyladenosine synthase
MNVYDAERIGELLEAEGSRSVATAADADLIVLNTCHIREKAAEKVYSEVGRILADARSDGRPRPRIVVAGCVAQAEGAEVIARAPAVDVVVGPQAYHRLPALLRAYQEEGRAQVDLDLPGIAKFDALPRRAPRAPPSAFLTIQEGCDKFCAFCVVPYTRGAEISRPAEQVLAEALRLVDGGAREIALLGQNVNAWKNPADPKQDFAWLLGEVAAIPGLARLRYTTSHPRDMTARLIEAHAQIPKLMPYLHLPVQSGSDRILKAMNRRHTAADYGALIERVRAARPDIAISGDFIVGFPGETDGDFADTLALIEAIGYAQAFSFKYSPRPGTPAAELEDQIPDEVKSARLQELQALLGRQQHAFNANSSGQRCEVLVERPGRSPGQWIGKSPWLQSVVVTPPDDVALDAGDLVMVELGRPGPNSIEGLLEPPLMRANS